MKMVSKAHIKYLRISPKKVRPVIALVKGKKALDAQNVLKTLNKKGAFLIEKALNSAIFNAKNKGYNDSKLFISKLVANSGPTLKRFRSASFGRASLIRKRCSHILVELDSSESIVEGVKIK